MKIGIDVRCLAEGRRTGVEEYTLNLLENIFMLNTRDEFILFFNSFRSSEIDFSWLEKYPNVRLRKFNFPNKILNLLFWYLNWPKIDKLIGGVDVFFMPNIIFGGVSKNVKLVSTIHDLSFERYPETFSWQRRLWHTFINPRKICQHSDRIIAVSQSTKSDIVNLYKINPDKITVSYNGLAEKFHIVDRNDANLIRVKEKYNLPYKFILYLGTIEPRKNISAVTQAYAQLQKKASSSDQTEIAKYKLVIAGADGWLSEKIFAEIAASNYKDDIMVIKFVSEEDKEFVLNLASLFVYPSRFEGFGLPPLEAMACGVPVITSNNSSLPEVVGDAAIMIDPDKPTEIAQAMQEILTNSELREKLMARGLVQSKKFTWIKPAEDFLKIINKL
jgi:glycosyltransferase involved in cell wall biosynthesis